jgi:ferredoxin
MWDDGLAYTKEATWKDLLVGSEDGTPTYKMGIGLAEVPEDLIDACIEAAEECPGECIFIEE